MDMEAVSLGAIFEEYVWLEKFVRNKIVRLGHAMGHFKLRYRANQVSNKPSLSPTFLRCTLDDYCMLRLIQI